MTQSVRIEILDLGNGGHGSPLNVIRGNPPVAVTIAVTNVASEPTEGPVVPTSGEWGKFVRLTAIENPVFVTWGLALSEAVAAPENTLRLAVELPEVLYVKDGTRFSFIAEQA